MKEPKLLLVEDSDGDAMLVKHILESADPPVPSDCITHAMDGVEAIEALLGEGPFADAGPFDLVLLDLRLPRKDGFEVLKAMREHPGKLPPTVVLSTSDLDVDKQRALDFGATEYMIKSFDIGDFRDAVHDLILRQLKEDA